MDLFVVLVSELQHLMDNKQMNDNNDGGMLAGATVVRFQQYDGVRVFVRALS